jgi:hypothetical protein
MEICSAAKMEYLEVSPVTHDQDGTKSVKEPDL